MKANDLTPEDERVLLAEMRRLMINQLARDLMDHPDIEVAGSLDTRVDRLLSNLATFDEKRLRGIIAGVVHKRRAQEVEQAALEAAAAVRVRQRERHTAAFEASDEFARVGFDRWLREQQRQALEPAWKEHLDRCRIADPLYDVPLLTFAASQEGQDVLTQAELQNL